MVGTCDSLCFWLFDVLLYFAQLSVSRDHYLIQNLRMLMQCLSWESQSTFTKAHVTGLPLFRVRIESQRSSMTCTKYFGFSLVAALKSRSSKLWSNCLAGCLKDCSRRSVTGTQLSCNDLLKQCKMWSAVTETLSFPDSYTFLPTVTFSVLLKHIVFLPGTSSAGT